MKSKISIPLHMLYAFALTLFGFGFTSGLALAGGKQFVGPLVLCGIGLALCSSALAMAARRTPS